MSRPERASTMPEALARMSARVERLVGGSRSFARVAAATALVLGALLLARRGTGPSRLGAASGLCALAITWAVLAWRERREAVAPARVLARVTAHVDPELAGRARRALGLLTSRAPGTSRALAELHVARVLASLPDAEIVRGALRTRRVHGLLGALGGGLALVLVGLGPFRVLEGADVLVARRGEAPLALAWLADADVRARPPDYLHLDERAVPFGGEASLPRGALLTVSGIPVHAGRSLFLSDGAVLVPFVDDGHGRVVARWPLAGTVQLRVLARFGDVSIPEPALTQVESIPDDAPIVTLEDAPKTIALAGPDAVTEIPIRYEATDDHGLREVHLVLRAAGREERRVLARLDGETRRDRGSHVVRAADPFLRRSHAPVEVRVEAKDNDPVTGPKWGASAALIVVPPDVGEAEAARLAALRELRDVLVKSLGARLDAPRPELATRAHGDEDRRRAQADLGALDAVLGRAFGPLHVPARVQTLFRSAAKGLRAAGDAEALGPSGVTHETTLKATERLTLVVDGALRGQGTRDARDVARELAEVADDLALGLAQTARADEAARGKARVDAGRRVLAASARHLLQLGALGRDLGEIVEAYLPRVDRAFAAGDVAHAELAARDLAARLREPDPSFGARGGAGRAGAESGAAGSGAEGEGAEGEGGEGDRAFEAAAQEVDRLVEEHADRIGRVEQSMNQGTTPEDVQGLKDEARRHADAVRQAVGPLPRGAGPSGSATQLGSEGREHAEEMARALEQGQLADAVARGKRATRALDDAKRAGTTSGALERDLDGARRSLANELKWAEDKLGELRQRASRRASGDLEGHAAEERRLADRMGGLAARDRDDDLLPESTTDSLRRAERAAREAAEALGRGDADRALERQRAAQQELEAARRALGDRSDRGDRDEGQEDGEGRRDDGARPNPTDRADIPSADAHKGPEELRRRVLRGLAEPGSGATRDAVRRYAEGLLR